jgi:hypothetical protein
MELRYDEAERARGIFERYVKCLPSVKAWVRYAKFEMQAGEVPRARRVYERAVEELAGEAAMVRPAVQASLASTALREPAILDTRALCPACRAPRRRQSAGPAA